MKKQKIGERGKEEEEEVLVFKTIMSQSMIAAL